MVHGDEPEDDNYYIVTHPEIHQKFVLVIVNCDYGGLRMTKEATQLYLEQTSERWSDEHSLRTDPAMIRIILDIGIENASEDGAMRLQLVPYACRFVYRLRSESDGYEYICMNVAKAKMTDISRLTHSISEDEDAALIKKKLLAILAAYPTDIDDDDDCMDYADFVMAHEHKLKR